MNALKNQTALFAAPPLGAVWPLQADVASGKPNVAPSVKTKPQHWLLLAAFTCLLLTACVSGGPRFQKVTDPNMLYDFPDFTVRSPPGGDWLLMRIEPREDLHGIRFYKDFHPTHFPVTHSFYVLAQSESATNTFADQKDFLAFAQQGCAQGNSTRHKVLESRCVLDARFGLYCVKFHIVAQDYGAHVGGAVLVMESTGYMFFHPSVSNRLVSVTYSERGRSDELNPSLNEAGERFIDAFEFFSRK